MQSSNHSARASTNSNQPRPRSTTKSGGGKPKSGTSPKSTVKKKEFLRKGSGTGGGAAAAAAAAAALEAAKTTTTTTAEKTETAAASPARATTSIPKRTSTAAKTTTTSIPRRTAPKTTTAAARTTTTPASRKSATAGVDRTEATERVGRATAKAGVGKTTGTAGVGNTTLRRGSAGPAAGRGATGPAAGRGTQGSAARRGSAEPAAGRASAGISAGRGKPVARPTAGKSPARPTAGKSPTRSPSHPATTTPKRTTAAATPPNSTGRTPTRPIPRPRRPNQTTPPSQLQRQQQQKEQQRPQQRQREPKQSPPEPKKTEQNEVEQQRQEKISEEMQTMQSQEQPQFNLDNLALPPLRHDNDQKAQQKDIQHEQDGQKQLDSNKSNHKNIDDKLDKEKDNDGQSDNENIHQSDKGDQSDIDNKHESDNDDQSENDNDNQSGSDNEDQSGDEKYDRSGSEYDDQRSNDNHDQSNSNGNGNDDDDDDTNHDNDDDQSHDKQEEGDEDMPDADVAVALLAYMNVDDESFQPSAAAFCTAATPAATTYGGGVSVTSSSSRGSSENQLNRRSGNRSIVSIERETPDHQTSADSTMDNSNADAGVGAAEEAFLAPMSPARVRAALGDAEISTSFSTTSGKKRGGRRKINNKSLSFFFLSHFAPSSTSIRPTSKRRKQVPLASQEKALAETGSHSGETITSECDDDVEHDDDSDSDRAIVGETDDEDAGDNGAGENGEDSSRNSSQSSEKSSNNQIAEGESPGVYEVLDGDVGGESDRLQKTKSFEFLGFEPFLESPKPDVFAVPSQVESAAEVDGLVQFYAFDPSCESDDYNDGSLLKNKNSNMDQSQSSNGDGFGRGLMGAIDASGSGDDDEEMWRRARRWTPMTRIKKSTRALSRLDSLNVDSDGEDDEEEFEDYDPDETSFQEEDESSEGDNENDEDWDGSDHYEQLDGEEADGEGSGGDGEFDTQRHGDHAVLMDDESDGEEKCDAYKQLNYEEQNDITTEHSASGHANLDVVVETICEAGSHADDTWSESIDNVYGYSGLHTIMSNSASELKHAESCEDQTASAAATATHLIGIEDAPVETVEMQIEVPALQEEKQVPDVDDEDNKAPPEVQNNAHSKTLSLDSNKEIIPTAGKEQEEEKPGDVESAVHEEKMEIVERDTTDSPKDAMDSAEDVDDRKEGEALSSGIDAEDTAAAKVVTEKVKEELPSLLSEVIDTPIPAERTAKEMCVSEESRSITNGDDNNVNEEAATGTSSSDAGGGDCKTAENGSAENGTIVSELEVMTTKQKVLGDDMLEAKETSDKTVPAKIGDLKTMTNETPVVDGTVSSEDPNGATCTCSSDDVPYSVTNESSHPGLEPARETKDTRPESSKFNDDHASAKPVSQPQSETEKAEHSPSVSEPASNAETKHHMDESKEADNSLSPELPTDSKEKSHTDSSVKKLPNDAQQVAKHSERSPPLNGPVTDTKVTSSTDTPGAEANSSLGPPQASSAAARHQPFNNSPHHPMARAPHARPPPLKSGNHQSKRKQQQQRPMHPQHPAARSHPQQQQAAPTKQHAATSAGAKSANRFAVVSLSFLHPNLSPKKACDCIEEAVRILRPGGRLYVVDWDGSTVNKLPDWARNWLQPVREGDMDSKMQKQYEQETQNILTRMGRQNYLDTHRITRWIGILSF